MQPSQWAALRSVYRDLNCISTGLCSLSPFLDNRSSGSKPFDAFRFQRFDLARLLSLVDWLLTIYDFLLIFLFLLTFERFLIALTLASAIYISEMVRL